MAGGDTLTAKELREILAENRTAGGGGFDTKNFSSLNSSISGLTGKMDPFSAAVKVAGDAVSGIKNSINESMGAWQKLSSSGASFNNDIIGMNVAAAGTRMSLAEMADVVKGNTQNFVGLGGSASQGAMAFTRLSKEMFDSGVTDQLRQMGMTNKDVNDTLALQLSFQRGTFKEDKASREASIESATKLATEMDMMAKMTGKTRAEQEDAIKKAAADAQVEAKMRLIGIQQGPEAEAKARRIFAEQYNEAQARGQGQMFKEVFATGRVVSQEAANQQAILGEQATATAAQARATAAGDEEAAREHNKAAQAAAMENQKDVGKLTMATMGEAGGVYGKVVRDQMDANRGLYDMEAKIRQEAAFKGATNEQVLAEAKRRIANEQAGKDKDGRDIAGAGTTKAVVQLQQRVGDVNSALMSGLVKPLNETIGPGLNKFSGKYLGATVDRKTATGKVETVGKGKAYEDTLAAGFRAGMENKNEGKSAKSIIKDRKGGEGYFGSEILGAAGATAGGLTNIAANGLDKINNLDISKSVKDKQAAGAAEDKTKTKAAGGESGGKEATLNDIHDSLERLNKSVSTMNGHTEAIKDLSGKQVKATNGLSNNRFP